MRRWTAASLLVVAGLYAGASGQWGLACAVAAVVVGALAFGARLALSPTVSRVVAAVAAAAGGGLGWIFAPAQGQPLRPPWPSFVIAGLLAGAALLCRRAGARTAAPALLPGLLALAACGEAPLGRVYALFAVAHLALALLALRAGDAHEDGGRRIDPPAFPRRRLALSAAVVGLAAAIAGVFAAGLPPLSLWTESRILHALGGAEVGFSDRMWLGSLDGMLQSDEVVLRVDGARADYLRGAVYDHYEIGRWGRLLPARPEPVVTAAPRPPSPTRTRILVVGGTRDRYFVPLRARDFATAEPNVAADRFGVLRVLRGAAREVSFEPDPPDGAPAGSAPPPDLPIAAASEHDLDIPPDLRRPLERIAREWTAGATTPEEKVAAISGRLRTTFTYSLHFDHRRRRDPLLDFLLDDHRGHCEYFATAMTLLSRAAGVPARVAVGYRVAEENPLGDYWVVRERNAHAWSEVFLAGKGFVTVDATPAGAVSQNEPHRGSLFGSAWDMLGASWNRAFAQLTLLHLAGGFAVVLVVGLVVRWARRGRGPREARGRQWVVARPPPSLERLLEALARKGAARAASEPLERFAARVEGAGMEGAAEMVRRWAAFRYGGVGDGEALARETEGWVERLRRG